MPLTSPMGHPQVLQRPLTSGRWRGSQLLSQPSLRPPSRGRWQCLVTIGRGVGPGSHLVFAHTAEGLTDGEQAGCHVPHSASSEAVPLQWEAERGLLTTSGHGGTAGSSLCLC